MARPCPYLGLQGDRRQVLLVPTPRHRCYIWGQGDRIGSPYQAATCLTSAYRRCPRLIQGSKVAEEQRSRGVEPQRSTPAPLRPYELVPLRPQVPAPSRPQVPAPSRLQIPAPPRPQAPAPPRRPLTFIELVVMSLIVSIILSFLFVGYAVFYRLRVGPGMEAAPVAARGAESTATPVPPTLMPTLTPVPSPSLTAPVAVPLPPTPIPEPTLPLPTASARPPAASPPTRLVIPRLDLDIPVLPVGVRTVWDAGQPKVVWDDVPNAGGFHQTSAYPGHVGNTVINGHRDIKGAVFRHLDRLEPGDEIILYVGDVTYPYRVVETLVVPETFASAEQRAENLRLIGYLPEERLTLVTCTPVGLATHRLLVIAKPPEQAAPQMPEAGSGTHP